jgi:transmembrane protein TMEM220
LTLLQLANGAMAVLFLFAVAVQYNDPDPLRWMAIYGLAALACVLSLAGRLPRFVPALVGLGALAWACILAPGVIGRVSAGELFQSYGMLSETVEEAREMGGLLIVAVWMGLLAFVGAGPVR